MGTHLRNVFVFSKFCKHTKGAAMSLEQWKCVTEIFANISILVAGLWAAYTYSRARQLERAKWLKDLYEKFYEKKELKEVRDVIDGGSRQAIRSYVEKEPSSFTDYLNFFEFVGYLLEKRQILAEEAIGLFDYYLKALRDEKSISSYIQNPTHGYEKLWTMIKTFPL